MESFEPKIVGSKRQHLAGLDNKRALTGGVYLKIVDIPVKRT